MNARSKIIVILIFLFANLLIIFMITKILKDHPDGVIATVNGQALTTTRFESYKASLPAYDASISDEAILERMIRQELVRQEAERLKLPVSEEEVEPILQENLAALQNDPVRLKALQEALSQKNITMDEYKEQTRQMVRDMLLIDAYTQYLETDYRENHPREVVFPEGKALYQQALQELLSQASIKIYR